MFSGETNGLKPHGVTLAIHIPGTFLALPTATKKSPKNRVTSRVLKKSTTATATGTSPKKKLGFAYLLHSL